MAWYDLLDCELGTLFVGGSGAGLHRVNFLRGEHALDDEVQSLEADSGEAAGRDPVAARPALEALTAYFGGAAGEFDGGNGLALAPRGTSFQQSVWAQLRAIPAGSTRSYGEIAAAVGKPGAARAVGGAVGRNPISLIVPCHRVIASDGSIGGFASGLDRKRWLLAHEGVEGYAA